MRIRRILVPAIVGILHSHQPAFSAGSTWNDKNSAAVAALDKGDYKKAANLLELAVKQARATKAGPSDLASVIGNLAHVYQKLEQFDKAEPLYKTALELNRKHHGANHRSTAVSMSNLGFLYLTERRFDEAEPLFKQSIAILKKQKNSQKDLAHPLNNLGFLYQNDGRLDEAKALHQQVLAIKKKAGLGKDLDTALTLNNLAHIAEQQESYAEAERLLNESLAITKSSFGINHPETARALNNLGCLYRKTERYAEAEWLLRHALEINRKVLGARHGRTTATANSLLDLFEGQGQHAKAKSLIKEVLDTEKKVLGADSPELMARVQEFALFYKDKGKYAEAIALFEQALEIAKNRFGAESSETAHALNNVALLYKLQGQYTEAEAHYDKSLAIARKTFSDKDLFTANLLNNLGALYIQQRRTDAAEKCLKESIEIYKESAAPQDPEAISPLNNLANLYRDLERYDEAESLYKEALAARKRISGSEDIETIGVLMNLANLYLNQHRNADAQPLLEKSLPIVIKELGPEHPDTATTIHSLARLYDAQELYPEAEKLYRQSQKIREENFGKESQSENALKTACLNELMKIPEKLAPTSEMELLRKSLKDHDLLIVPSLWSARKLHQSKSETNTLLSQQIELLIAARLQAVGGTGEVLINQAADSLEKQAADTGSDKAVLCRLLLANANLQLENGQRKRSSALGQLVSRLLAIRNDSLDQLLIADLHMSLAALLSQMGNYGQASTHLEAARELTIGERPTTQIDSEQGIKQEQLSSRNIMHARVLLRLSELAFQQADYANANEFGSKALSLKAIESPQLHSERIKILLCLSLAATKSGAAKLGIDYAEQALKSCTESDADETRVNIEIAYAKALTKVNRAPEAVLSLEHLVGSMGSTAERKDLVANLRHAQAESRLSIGDYQSAKVDFSKALEILNESAEYSDSLRQVEALFGIAICDAHLGETNSQTLSMASLYLDRYIKEVFPNLSFSEQRWFAQKLDWFASVRAVLGFTLPNRKDEDVLVTYAQIMKWRGLLIEGLRTQSLLNAKANQPEFAQVYSKWRGLKREIADISSKAEVLPELRESIKSLSASKESLERKLLGGESSQDPLESLGDFMQSIGEDEAFVDFCSYRNADVTDEKKDSGKHKELGYFLVVVSRKGFTCVELPEVDTILKAIDDWRQAVLSSRIGRTRRLQLPYFQDVLSTAEREKKKDEAWRILKTLLCQPLLSALPEGCRKIVLCDDANFSLVPWGKLVDDVSTVDRSTTRIDSPREFFVLRRPRTKPETAQDGTATAAKSDMRNFVLIGGVDYRDESLRLDGTAAEVSAIKELVEKINEGNSAVKLDPIQGLQPTREKVNELLPGANIAHFATHGYFAENDASTGGSDLASALSQDAGDLLSVRNPLVLSGILLAPNPIASEDMEVQSDKTNSDNPLENEEKLTAEEIVGIDLRKCDLFVLSACDTGRGVQERGQGVLGLRSAIMSAGTKTLIISLWPVDDEATRFLMTEFYRQLLVEHKPKAEALKLAQQSVRGNKEHPEWEDPYYWAAWAIIGEG